MRRASQVTSTDGDGAGEAVDVDGEVTSTSGVPQTEDDTNQVESSEADDATAELDAAATKIQAMYRGHSVRSSVIFYSYFHNHRRT